MDIITVMLHQKADKRPGVDLLLQHQQLQVRIKEKKYKDKYASLKKKEHELIKREKEIESNKNIQEDLSSDKELAELLEKE